MGTASPVVVRRRRVPTRRRRQRELSRFWLLGLQVVTIASVIGAWHLAVERGWLDSLLVGSPGDVWSHLVDYVGHPRGRHDMWISLQEAFWGLTIAIVVGIPFGLALGMSRILEAMCMPFVIFAVSSPRVALIPIFVIWLGIGVASKVALILLMAIIPILINARASVTLTDRDLIRVCRAFNGSRLQTFTKVILPSAVPSIIAGVRLGIANGLVAVVVGEFYASTAGIGYSIALAGSLFQTSKVIALVFIVGITGVIISVFLGRIERHFDRWRPSEVTRT